MYCPKCGTLNQDGVAFCIYCGQALSEQPAADPAAAEQTTSGASESFMPQTYAPVEQAYSPEGAAGGYPPAGNFPGRFAEAIRRVLTSPVFLVVAVAYTVASVASILAQFLPGKGTEQLLKQFSEQFQDLTGEALQGMDVSFSLPSFSFGGLISILVVIALWTLYANAKSGTVIGKKPWQLTTFRILAILSAVGMGIATGGFLLLAVVLGIGGAAVPQYFNQSETGDMQEFFDALREYGIELDTNLSWEEFFSAFFVVLSVACVICALIMAFVMVYYIVSARCFRKGAQALAGEDVNAKGLTFVAVLTAISGVFSALGFFAELASAVGGMISPVAPLATLGSAVYSFALCVLFLRTKKEIDGVQTTGIRVE